MFRCQELNAFTLVMLHKAIDFFLFPQTSMKTGYIWEVTWTFLKPGLNMIASYLICYQNTNPLYFMRIRDICLKFIEIQCIWYPCCMIWGQKNIQYLCFILYDRTKPTRLMKYVATIVEKCSVEMETNVRFLCRFFSHVSKWWVYDNSLDICEILMNICNETWIVWEEVIRIDMCVICVYVCMCVCTTCMCVQ